MKVRILALLTLVGLMFALVVKYVSAVGYEYPVGGNVEFPNKIILVAPIVSLGIVAIVVLGIIAKRLTSKSADS